MRRPAGVVFLSAVLGIFSAILLLLAVICVVALPLMGRLQSTTPQAPPPPHDFMVAAMIGCAIFYAALAAWGISTTVGLLRLRNWARISTVVIGAGLVLMGLLVGSITLLMASAGGTLSPAPAQDPAIQHAVFLAMAVFWFLVAAAGLWWIIYPLLRSTREAFAFAAVQNAPPPTSSAAPPLQSSQATYASAVDEISVPEPHGIIAPPVAASGRPLAITVIGWLYLVSLLVMLPFLFLPIPLFFFGITSTGVVAKAIMLCFGVISLAAGIGLLRLKKFGLYAAYLSCSLGTANTALLLIPSVRERMQAYSYQWTQTLMPGMPPPTPFQQHLNNLMMIPGLVFGLLFMLVFFVLLYRNRTAFEKKSEAKHPYASA